MIADHTTVIDGQTLYYRTAGDSPHPHVMLLNGWGARLTGWLGSDRVIAELARYFYVVSPELPGFMRSPPPKRPWTLEDHGQLLHHLLESLRLNPPILIGQSFGGAFTATYARLFPRTIRCLVLVDALLVGETNLYHWVIRKIPSLARVVNSPCVPLSITRLAWSLYVGVPRAMLTAENVHEYLVMPRLQTSPDLPIDERGLRAPLFLVWGHRDWWVTPLARARKLHADMPTARLIVVRGGHTILYRKPACVIAAIRQGLRELLPMPPGSSSPTAGPTLPNARVV